MEEPSSDEVKEVYARFGLAYYESEVLHRGLSSLFAILPFEDSQHVTRFRLEERYRMAWSSTLGQIVREFDETILNDKLVERLGTAVARRNHLAHGFWFERIHLMFSTEGIRQLLDELDSDLRLFSELDAEIESILAARSKALGLTDEILAQSLEEVKKGKDLEPLHEQRFLKKQERIIAAYDVFIPGGTRLIFETDDHLFWTLSDAGLGWSPYTESEDNWRRNSQLSKYLPATINPRPDIERPWHYSLELRKGVLLNVWLSKPGMYAWKIELED